MLIVSCICSSGLFNTYASNYRSLLGEENSEFDDFGSQIETIKELPSSTNIEDMYGKASGQYNLECEFDLEAIEENMIKKAQNNVSTPSTANNEKELIVNTHDVKIELLHDQFIDAIYSENGIFTNVSSIADWSSDNPAVVSVFQGRLMPDEVGKASITVEYNGLKELIRVEVVNNLHTPSNALRKALRFPKPNLARDRQEALNRALDMINFTWKTTGNLTVWQHTKQKKSEVFPAGTTVKGIIYTQSINQTDLEEFKEALKKSDFYDVYIGKFKDEVTPRTMPRYGSDCSGFVSIAWGTIRYSTYTFFSAIREGIFTKVGNYNLDHPNKASLLEAYKMMQPGDALLRKGHIMLVASVDIANKNVTVYEQTPYHARIFKKTFADLLSGVDENGKPNPYRPFTRFSGVHQPHWQKEGNKWYYYGADGAKVTNWQKIDGEWYYFDSNGVMLTGWQKIDGAYYYLHSDGRMVHSDWVKDKNDNKWYYLHGNGKMASHEWITTKGKSYYVHSNGQMATNEWVQWTGGYWYYLMSDGVMAQNQTLIIKGVSYRFDKSGKCLNPNG